MPYCNVPRAVAVVVSSGLAEYIDLQTVYGTADLYKLLEIVAIDMYNKHQLAKHGRPED